MVTSKLDVSKERLKAAVDTADGRPRAIVFTADVKAILEAYEEQEVDLEVYRLNHTALKARAAKLEAELDAARDRVVALLELRHS